MTGLVAQFRSIELLKRTPLETRLNGLESRRTALSDLDSKLSTLFAITDRFTDTVLFDPFAARDGLSSDESVVKVSADSTAQVGTHDLEVTRLASTDTRVSDLFTGIDTDFDGIVTDQTFDILVAHPTDDDESNRLAVTVTVSAASFAKTNEGLFKDIAAAINDAIAAEISAGNLEATERVTATFVEESSGDARLILRSGETGSDKALEFTDTDGLLGTLGLTRTTAAKNNNGGYITAEADLDAEFVLDGLTFVRGSNSVDDALTGVTLQLVNVSVDPLTITIESATQSVRDELDTFIEAYNEALKFVRQGTRSGGQFAGDATYSTIAIQLRSITSSQVTGASTTSFDRIHEIGLQTNNDGTLFFEDASLFEAALAADPTLISDIFNASDGIATQLKDYIVNFTRTSGTITISQRSITNSITFQNERLEAFDDRLDQRVARFKAQLIRLQTALSQVQAQAAFFQSFFRN